MNNNEYPKNRNWKYKTYGMPKLPTSDIKQSGVIIEILEAVNKGDTPNKYIKFKGNENSFQLERLCEWLRPIGLVNKENSIWKLTDLSEIYLKNKNDLYLTAIFCSSLVFMGEILYYLDKPKKINELLEIAVSDYKINWKTASEIRNRLKWFRDLEMVYYEDFRQEYSLTEKGREFLNTIEVIMPEQIEVSVDKTLFEDSLQMSEWALEFWKNNSDTEKKINIGYIPGKTSDAIPTLNGYLQLLTHETTIDEIREYSKTNYQIASSSSNMTLAFLSNIGFVDRITKNSYLISEIGKKWLADSNDLDFIICLDKRFLFVFDLILELSIESKTAKELTTIAKVSYGFDRENIDEIRKRIIFLKKSNLIIEDGFEKYKVTNRGKKLIESFALEISDNNKIINNIEIEDEPKSKDIIDELITELRLSSKDSSNPNRFEKAIKEAFEYLGFKSILLGGPGKTDVLIQAQTTEKYSYKVAVDAKSTSSGFVGEGLVNFNSLEEHKELHKADYNLIVACNFQNGKIIERAEKNKVALLDIDSFESLLREHSITPLTNEDYRKIFEQSGVVNIELIEDARNITIRYGLLVSAIMKCLIEESTDEVTEGVLTSKEIYRSVRDNKDYDIEPSISEIEDIVEILSSPLIRCIGKNKDGYYAIGSLNEAGNKFKFYARACLNNN